VLPTKCVRYINIWNKGIYIKKEWTLEITIVSRRVERTKSGKGDIIKTNQRSLTGILV
jgi:hypothetical protein